MSQSNPSGAPAHACSSPNDQHVAQLAERRMRETTYSALHGVCCEFRDGVAVLRGAVPTFYLKQVAQSVVGKLEEVKQIENRIQVAGAGAGVDRTQRD